MDAAISLSKNTPFVEVLDWQAIVDRHYLRIQRAALMLTGDPWEAEDLAQETFYEAIKTSGQRTQDDSKPNSQFAGRSSIETWLYAILLNRHRRRLRTAGRTWRRWLDWIQLVRQQHVQPLPEENLQREEWRASLWSEVARLPAALRYTVVLRYSEELSYREISEAMACPEGTVKSRLHKAMAVLNERLGDRDRHKKNERAS